MNKGWTILFIKKKKKKLNNSNNMVAPTHTQNELL